MYKPSGQSEPSKSRASLMHSRTTHSLGTGQRDRGGHGENIKKWDMICESTMNGDLKINGDLKFMFINDNLDMNGDLKIV